MTSENKKLILDKDTASYMDHSRQHPDKWPREPYLMLKQIERLEDQPLFDKAIEFLNIRKGNKILEIGGGRCDASFLFERQGAKMTCLDKNIDDICGLGAAQKIKDFMSSKIELVEGNYHNMNFADNYFDKAYARSAAHHAYDMNKLFLEIYRVLKPGGIVVMEEPAKGYFISDKFTYRNYYKKTGTGDEQNERSPTIKEWVDFAKSAGFRNVKIIYGFNLTIESVLQKLYNKDYSDFKKFDFPMKKVALLILSNKFINRVLFFGIKALKLPINIWLRYFGWPPFVPHIFTGGIGGFEYFATIIYLKK